MSMNERGDFPMTLTNLLLLLLLGLARTGP
jgi:hypothetical protein